MQNYAMRNLIFRKKIKKTRSFNPCFCFGLRVLKKNFITAAASPGRFQSFLMKNLYIFYIFTVKMLLTILFENNKGLKLPTLTATGNLIN
jgi:hypothetical protein